MLYNANRRPPCIDSWAVRPERYLTGFVRVAPRLLCPLLLSFYEGGYASWERLRLSPLSEFCTGGGVNIGAFQNCPCKSFSQRPFSPADELEPVVVSFREFPWLSLLLPLTECSRQDVPSGLRSRGCE